MNHGVTITPTTSFAILFEGNDVLARIALLPVSITNDTLPRLSPKP
jgi:hypothetical protein